MSEIKIESGIPISPRMRSSNYPFEALEVGQSFCVEGKSPQQISNVRNYWANKLGRSFVARKIENGCRIWRTE